MRHRLLIIAFLLCLSVQTALAQSERVVRVGVYNFAPIIFIDPDGNPRGLYLDVLEHIAARERWKLEYVKGSWAESLARLEKGEIDLQPSIGYTEARDKVLDFNRESLFLDWGVVYRQRGKALDTLLDLEGKKIAVLKGSVYTEGLQRLLDQFGLKASLVEKSEYTEVLRALNNREVDAGIITKVYGLSIEDKYPNIDATTVYFSPLKLLFATPQGKGADLLDALDRHFAELKADKNSVYYQSHAKWLESPLRKVVMPAWLYWVALGVLILLVLLAGSRRFLLRKVEEQTRELRQAFRQIQSERHRFEDLVQTADGIVWEADAGTLAFTFVSNQAERLLGYPIDDWLRPGFRVDHMHPDDRELTAAVIADSLLHKTPATIEYRMLARDGQVVWLQDIMTVTVEDGEATFLRGLMVDITQRKAIEEELRELNLELDQRVRQRTVELERANQELAEANKELESFSYSISHDLRVPLRAIDGFSHMLLKRCDATLDAESRRLLTVVRENSARMSQLIDDILAFSRAGRQEMHRVECDVEGMIRSLWLELKPPPDSRVIEFTLNPLPRVHADPILLRQVMVNLLTNAIKFTQHVNPARIVVEAHREGDEVIYSIRDNGAGFDQEYVGKLFGVFQRLHGIDEFDGTGVGLAIVKSIVTRHGGRVRAEGKVNGGATLYIILPAKEF